MKDDLHQRYVAFCAIIARVFADYMEGSSEEDIEVWSNEEFNQKLAPVEKALKEFYEIPEDYEEIDPFDN